MKDALHVSFGELAPSSRVEMRLSPLEAGVFFESKDMDLSPCVEALIAASLLPAMKRGGVLHWSGVSDAKFVNAMGPYQARRLKWSPELKPITLKGEVEDSIGVREPGQAGRVALFFSGGVDSMYSLLENFEEVTDLIFVHGFDIAVDDEAHARMTEEHLRAVAEYCGKNLIWIRTNLRPAWLNDAGQWGGVCHGAAMAAVAHLLGSDFRRVLIAGSDNTPIPWPWGSHPDMDPLWSSSKLEFVHDRREVDRVDKIRRVMKSKIGQGHLRVCWKNRDVKVNCCRCEKCMRTMIALKALGLLEDCDTFDEPLSLVRVAWMRLPLPVSSAVGQIENLKLMRNHSDCRALRYALRLAFIRCWLFHLLGWHKKHSHKKDAV